LKYKTINDIWIKYIKKINVDEFSEKEKADINSNFIATKDKKNRWILYPDDTAKLIWDNVMGIFIILSAILTPYNLAFRGLRFRSASYNNFMYTIDAFFILDIFINFITAFEDQN
jgi:hypothetical protein